MMRTLAALLVAATLGGCVVTVPLRTVDAGREPMPTDRTYATAFVERFDSLGRPTAPERVMNLYVDGYGARWQTVLQGDTVAASASDIHALTISHIQRRAGGGVALGLLIGRLAPVVVGAAMDARCEEGGACGWHTLEGAFVARATAMLGVIVGAVGWPDRRHPVRYVVTPARVD